ncbi:hypothetical protein BKA82DRAFT_2539603 [Pisolithus tinctorius]|nr:hypothetical protein BKA82DRAFT_2539603 [Pisolithus tinctorius]
MATTGCHTLVPSARSRTQSISSASCTVDAVLQLLYLLYALYFISRKSGSKSPKSDPSHAQWVDGSNARSFYANSKALPSGVFLAVPMMAFALLTLYDSHAGY